MPSLAEEFFGIFKDKDSENDFLSLSNIDFNKIAESSGKELKTLGFSGDDIVIEIKNMITKLDFSSIPFYVELKAIVNYQTGEVYDDYEFYLKKNNIEYSQVALKIFKDIKFKKDYEIIRTIREKDIKKTSSSDFIYVNDIFNDTVNDMKEQVSIYFKYKNNFKNVMSEEDFKNLDIVMNANNFIIKKFLDLVKNKNLITIQRKDSNNFLSISVENFDSLFLIEKIFNMKINF